jgi:hypothetical protein
VGARAETEGESDWQAADDVSEHAGLFKRDAPKSQGHRRESVTALALPIAIFRNVGEVAPPKSVENAMPDLFHQSRPGETAHADESQGDAALLSIQTAREIAGWLELSGWPASEDPHSWIAGSIAGNPNVRPALDNDAKAGARAEENPVFAIVPIPEPSPAASTKLPNTVRLKPV